MRVYQKNENEFVLSKDMDNSYTDWNISIRKPYSFETSNLFLWKGNIEKNYYGVNHSPSYEFSYQKDNTLLIENSKRQTYHYPSDSNKKIPIPKAILNFILQECEKRIVNL
ncbi:hypothetical protein CVD28_01250 [Bacillus sp. M6-12]|uniref:hypothetical protein n=1 Tax=Bacillus sp. M6-12 TaxID=2054166 RepID=UPI000C789F96|nr:hypothetical protein [Bacillus sp. M6-12]PLS19060.1 hypothetical protein CVD28_01250 [Bacillus sp. M6-12]